MTCTARKSVVEEKCRRGPAWPSKSRSIDWVGTTPGHFKLIHSIFEKCALPTVLENFETSLRNCSPLSCMCKVIPKSPEHNIFQYTNWKNTSEMSHLLPCCYADLQVLIISRACTNTIPDSKCASSSASPERSDMTNRWFARSSISLCKIHTNDKKDGTQGRMNIPSHFPLII